MLQATICYPCCTYVERLKCCESLQLWQGRVSDTRAVQSQRSQIGELPETINAGGGESGTFKQIEVPQSLHSFQPQLLKIEAEGKAEARQLRHGGQFQAAQVEAEHFEGLQLWECSPSVKVGQGLQRSDAVKEAQLHEIGNLGKRGEAPVCETRLVKLRDLDADV